MLLSFKLPRNSFKLSRLKKIQLTWAQQLLQLFVYIEKNQTCIPCIKHLELFGKVLVGFSGFEALIIPLIYKLVHLRTLILGTLPQKISKSVHDAVGLLPELRQLTIWMVCWGSRHDGLITLAEVQDSGITKLSKLAVLTLERWNGHGNENLTFSSSLQSLTLWSTCCTNVDLQALCEKLPMSLRALQIDSIGSLSKNGIYGMLGSRLWPELEQFSVFLCDMVGIVSTDSEAVFSNMPKLQILDFNEDLFSTKAITSTSIKYLAITCPTYSPAQLIYLAHQLRPSLQELHLRFTDTWESTDWSEMDQVATSVSAS